MDRKTSEKVEEREKEKKKEKLHENVCENNKIIVTRYEADGRKPIQRVKKGELENTNMRKRKRMTRLRANEGKIEIEELREKRKLEKNMGSGLRK